MCVVGSFRCQSELLYVLGAIFVTVCFRLLSELLYFLGGNVCSYVL